LKNIRIVEKIQNQTYMFHFIIIQHNRGKLNCRHINYDRWIHLFWRIECDTTVSFPPFVAQILAYFNCNLKFAVKTTQRQLWCHNLACYMFKRHTSKWQLCYSNFAVVCTQTFQKIIQHSLVPLIRTALI